MTVFEARIRGEKLILKNKTGKTIFIREVLIKYRVTVTTVDEKTALKTITDSVKVDKTVQDEIEIPLASTDVVGVSVIYVENNVTLREDISL